MKPNQIPPSKSPKTPIMRKPFDLNLKPEKDRKWEDLDPDCLACIFVKVGMESLLMFVPFVCKAWYKATFNPLCWERLIFPDDEEKDADHWSLGENAATRPWTSANSTENSRFDFFMRRYARQRGIGWQSFSVPGFIMMAVSRSCGTTKFLKIPGLFTHYTHAVEEILKYVGKHCKDFVGFHLTNASVGEIEAGAIAKFVPNLKYLCLRKSEIGKGEVVMLLKECKELVVFDLRNCEGFNEKDEEILKLASHIPKFMCSRSGAPVYVANYLGHELFELIDLEQFEEEQ